MCYSMSASWKVWWGNEQWPLSAGLEVSFSRRSNLQTVSNFLLLKHPTYFILLSIKFHASESLPGFFSQSPLLGQASSHLLPMSALPYVSSGCLLQPLPMGSTMGSSQGGSPPAACSFQEIPGSDFLA